MMRRLALALLIGLALPGVARAVEPDEILKDPALEARARAISEGLRCLVCQNESIDDSHATLARDIRVLVRQRLEAGDTNAQVSNYLVSRYGQFILLKPPIELSTLLLWGTPPDRPGARGRRGGPRGAAPADARSGAPAQRANGAA